MAENEKEKYKLITQVKPTSYDPDAEQAGGTGDQGRGGSSGGKIEYHDFISFGESARDELPLDEQRRLLAVHQDQNEANVKKSKERKEHYKALKESKKSLEAYRKGLAEFSANSPYEQNPILAEAAQFSGIDRQVNALPTENAADTNEAARNDPELEYQLRYSLQNTPHFNPTPKPPM